MRKWWAGPAAVVLVGAGYLWGQATAPDAAQAQFGQEYCTYRTSTRFFPGGSYTVLTAVVAEWDSLRQEWRSVSNFAATNAVGGYSCTKE